MFADQPRRSLIHEPRLTVLLALRKPLHHVSLLDLVGKAQWWRSGESVLGHNPTAFFFVGTVVVPIAAYFGNGGWCGAPT